MHSPLPCEAQGFPARALDSEGSLSPSGVCAAFRGSAALAGNCLCVNNWMTRPPGALGTTLSQELTLADCDQQRKGAASSAEHGGWGQSEGDLGWPVIRGLPVALEGTCQPGSCVRAGSACSMGGSHGQSEKRVDLAVRQTCGSACSQICLGQGWTWMRGNLPGRVTQDEQGDPPLPSAVRAEASAPCSILFFLFFLHCSGCVILVP